MASAFEVKKTLKWGLFQFGKRAGAIGGASNQVHDGDTVGLSTSLNFSSRFLGVDAPEVSFPIRTDGPPFVAIGDEKWKNFWTSGTWKDQLSDVPLKSHLEARIGNGADVASNHKTLADTAKEDLRRLIEADRTASGKTNEEFKFFLAFSYEFLDGFARMLCFLHPDRDNFATHVAPSKLSYNEQLLATGSVVPYFIYPNTEPFLKIQPFEQSNLVPAKFWQNVSGASRLQQARRAVAAARTAELGVFHPTSGLKVLPYEIRFLARANSKGPDRHVIDLGKPGENKILKPEKYFTIANVEDRLFIGKEFVPLFTLNGWQT
jgi:hypothetical protein